MKRAKLLMTAAALLTAATVLLQAQASSQEIKGQVQLKVGTHDVKMTESKLYEITLDAPKEHSLNVSMPGPTVFVRDKNFRVEKMYFIANRTGEFKITVMPQVGFSSFTADYTLKVNEIILADKPILAENNAWTDQDPVYQPQRNSHFKDFKIKGKAGRVLVIDLVRINKTNADPYLYLEGPDGKVVANDDDSGGNLNARIVYVPTQDGEFRIIATTLVKATGDFSLTVREAK